MTRTAFKALAATELKLFRRDPATVFWAVVFPLVLLIVIGSIPSSREVAADLGDRRFIDLYVPVLVALVLAVLAVSALPAILANYRERGVLRRLATTPVSPAGVLAAQLVVNLAAAATAIALVLVVARVAFGVALPAQPAGFLVAFALTAAALLALGLLVAAVAPTARIAGAIGALLFFPMMFFAGLWLPRAAMPESLLQISDYTPLGAAVGALQSSAEGDWPRALHLAVLAGYTLVFAAAARRLFRWE